MIPVPPLPRQDVVDLIRRPRGTLLLEPGEKYDDWFTNETDGIVLAFTARQGGGNDECWCDRDELSDDVIEYDGDIHEAYCLYVSNRRIEKLPGFIAMQYDDFDTTYNVFFFEYDGTKEECEAAYLAHATAVAANARDKRLELCEKRGLDPAHADNPTLPDLLHRYDRLKNEDFDTAVLDEELAELKSIRADVLNDKADKAVYDKYSISLYDRETIQKHLKASRDNLLAARVEEEMNNLPEGSALREFLFRDNGTFTYKTKVVPPGKRRTVPTTRKAQRPTVATELIDKLRSKPHVMDSHRDRAVRAVAPIDRAIDAVRRKIQTVENDRTALESIETQLGL